MSENPYDPPRVVGEETKPDSPAKRLLTIAVLVLFLPFLVYAAIDFVVSARRSAERDEQRRLQQQALPKPAPAPAFPKNP